jgi:hypothetical protein
MHVTWPSFSFKRHLMCQFTAAVSRMWAGQNTETSRKCLCFVGCLWTVVSLLFLFFCQFSVHQAILKFLSLPVQSPFSTTKFCPLHNVIFLWVGGRFIKYLRVTWRHTKVSESSSGAKELLIYSPVRFLHVVMWRIAYGGTTLKNAFREERLHFFWQ